MKIFKNTINPILYSFILILSSLILNLSLRFMGYDLGNELLSYLNQDFIYKLSLLYLKILFIYFFYLSFIAELIYVIFPNKKYFNLLFLCISTFFLILILASSVVEHPQLYSDFFYIKHTYLLSLLYLLTDNSNPYIYVYIIYISLLVYTIYILFLLILKREFIYLITICYVIIFILFHSKGEFVGLILSYVGYKILSNFSYKINLKYSLSILSFTMLFSLFIFYYEYKFLLSPISSSNNPSIFIISADSLRKDKIGFIRNGKSITPNIDEFIKGSFNFKDHLTTIPRTFPSWTDLLTGKYSMEHKIRDMFPAPEEVENIGSEKFPTIGKILQSKGYESAVFSNFAGDIFPRADFGYKIVKAPNFNAEIILIQKAIEPQIFLLPILSGTLGGGQYFSEISSFSNLGDGKYILKDLLPFIRLNSDKNVFVTAFFSVIHFPYSPPYPYYKLYSDPEYYGKFKYFKFVDPTNDSKPSDKDIEQIRALFDESISAFDYNFGEFINQLKKSNLYNNSIIILTGDHGESLYEDVHGHGHGEHLRGENVLGVPLIIKFPEEFTEKIKQDSLLKENQNWSTFNGITSSIDIFPTIMDYMDIPLQKDYPGKSLMKILGKNNWDADRMVYAETGIWFSDIGDHFFQRQRIMYPNILKLHRVVPEKNYQIMITDPFYRDSIAFSKHRTIINSKYKFIYIPTHDGVEYELYDRINDPLNKFNLYPGQSIEPYRNELYSISRKWENSKVISDYILPPPLE